MRLRRGREPDLANPDELVRLKWLSVEAAPQVIPIAEVDRGHRSISIEKGVDAEWKRSYELEKLTSKRTVGHDSVHQRPKPRSHDGPILAPRGLEQIDGQLRELNGPPRIEVVRQRPRCAGLSRYNAALSHTPPVGVVSLGIKSNDESRQPTSLAMVISDHLRPMTTN
jgi:hypothetical protein